MAEQISSQQALSTSANTTLFSALDGNMTAADWIGYIVSLSDGLEAGIAAKQAVLDGEFEISTSQVAAQTKSLSEAQGTTDINGTPTATIVIDGQSYDISSILDSSVYYWANATGNGKNAQTNYHMREVFTDLGDDAPSGYSDNWDDPPVVNQPPVATPIVAEVDETLSEFDAHVRTNLDADNETFDLRDGATDPDGDDLNVVGTPVVVVTDGDGNPIESAEFLSISGNTLTIDQNSRALDALKAGESYNVLVTYTLSDGNGGEVETTASVTINGSLDEYKAQESDSVSETFEAETNGNGNFNNKVLYVDPLQIPTNSIDEANFVATIELSSHGLDGNDKGQITDSGDDVDWTTGAIQVDDASTSSGQVPLVAGAVEDGVTYNAKFNNVEAGDSITVTLNYTYDYWYLA